MNVARSAAEVLSQHTTLALECVDRMYLNVYVPLLQTAAGAAHFFREMRGAAWPSSVLMAPITERFVNAIKSYAARNGIDVVTFRRGERKDERTREYLRKWPGGEGVLYIGRAQEKARVLRTERRHDPRTGTTYPWLVDSTAMVNHYYIYAVDDDFGPFFLKFCSYFPYNAKLCINGHEYLKRQLTKRDVAFEALDNGILRYDDPEGMQRLADGLTAARVDALLRKWLARLPHPFAARDRQQGSYIGSSGWGSAVDMAIALEGDRQLGSMRRKLTVDRNRPRQGISDVSSRAHRSRQSRGLRPDHRPYICRFRSSLVRDPQGPGLRRRGTLDALEGRGTTSCTGYRGSCRGRT